MVHNTFHCPDILIVTFNVHLNAYLSNHVQLILYGIHVSMFAIGLQSALHPMETAAMDRLRIAAVETAIVHRHHPIAAPAAVAMVVAVVHHLIPMGKRNVRLLNARNVVIMTEDILETADIIETADILATVDISEDEDPAFQSCHSHHFQSVFSTAFEHISEKLFDYFLFF